MSNQAAASRASYVEQTAPSKADARRTADYLCNQMRLSAHKLHLAIPPLDVCRRLRIALEEATFDDQPSMEKLREAVCEFTALLRDTGTSPESVLVSIKAVINIHALPPMGFDPGDRTGYRMQSTISTWAIEEFFSRPGSVTKT